VSVLGENQLRVERRKKIFHQEGGGAAALEKKMALGLGFLYFF
jgi:hypothetical protein